MRERETGSRATLTSNVGFEAGTEMRSGGNERKEEWLVKPSHGLISARSTKKTGGLLSSMKQVGFPIAAPASRERHKGSFAHKGTLRPSGQRTKELISKAALNVLVARKGNNLPCSIPCDIRAFHPGLRWLIRFLFFYRRSRRDALCLDCFRLEAVMGTYAVLNAERGQKAVRDGDS